MSIRFLHLIKPVMCILPEVASPDRKVYKQLLNEFLQKFVINYFSNIDSVS